MGLADQAQCFLARKAFSARRSSPVPDWGVHHDLLDLPQPLPQRSFRKVLPRLGATMKRAARKAAACLPGATASVEDKEFERFDFSDVLHPFLDGEAVPSLPTSSRHVHNPLSAHHLNKLLSYSIAPKKRSPTTAAPLLLGTTSPTAGSPTPSPADPLAYIRPAAGYYSPCTPPPAPAPTCVSAAPTSLDESWWSDSDDAWAADAAPFAIFHASGAVLAAQYPPPAAAPASAVALTTWPCVKPAARFCSTSGCGSLSTADSWDSDGSSASALAWAAPTSWPAVVKPDPRYSSSGGSSDASAISCDAYGGGSTSGEDERDERDVGREDQGLLVGQRRGGRASDQGKPSPLLSRQFWRARCAEVRGGIERAFRHPRC